MFTFVIDRPLNGNPYNEALSVQKMKKIFLYSILFHTILSNPVFSAQEKTIYGNDTLKVLSLLKQIRLKYGSDRTFEPVDSANLYHALQLSIKDHFVSGEAQCYDVLGVRERNRANYAKALEYHLKALELLVETSRIRDKAITLNNIGVVYRRLDDFAHATEYHLNALKLAEQINDVPTICVSLNS